MRKPDIRIWKVTNGYIVETLDGPEITEDDASMLWAVAEHLCDMGNRHSARRLRIVYQPGDKHHDLHPQPCSTCDCGCDPDQSAPDDAGHE